MPTLLSINNYHYRRGGAEAVFLEQNRLFEQLGWRVAPFAMHHAQNLPTPWSDYFVEEIEFGAQYSALEKLTKIPKVIYSLEARRKLDALLNKVRPHIAHAHNVYHHISPSIFGLLKRRGVPVVLTLHDLKLACPAYKMLTHDGVCERCKGGALHHVMLHRCVKNSLALSGMILLETLVHRALRCYTDHVDRLVTPSRFYLEKLVEWGWERERFVHVPNFVDCAVHRPNYTPGSAFLYFGRLGPEKGVRTLIEAAAAARVPLWIAGSGPEETMLRQHAAQLGADVTFLGYQSGDALHDCVRRARAVVLPSEWYENAPISVLESYALGKPVIGAAIGGIPELIREGQTGATFASGDAAALAAVLRDFADTPAKRLADMGHVARAWVENCFTAERYIERLMHLYSEFGICAWNSRYAW